MLHAILTLYVDGLLELHLQLLLAVVDLHLGDVFVLELLHRHGGFHICESTAAIREHGEGVDGNENGRNDGGDPQHFGLFHSSCRLSENALLLGAAELRGASDYNAQSV